MVENDDNRRKVFQGKEYISMLEASNLCSYSQEYLSLLARRGRIEAKKIGRNWYITREALNGYLQKQSIVISLPKNMLANQNSSQVFKSEKFGKPILISSLTPEEPDTSRHSRVYEEFLKLNQQSLSDVGPAPEPLVSKSFPKQNQQAGSEASKPADPMAVVSETVTSKTVPSPVTPVVVRSGKTQEQLVQVVEELQRTSKEQGEIEQAVVRKLDKLSDSLMVFAEKIGSTTVAQSPDQSVSRKIDQLSGSLNFFAEKLTEKTATPPAVLQQEVLTPDQKEFFEVESQTLGYKLNRVNAYSQSLLGAPRKAFTIMVTAIVILFLLVGGFSFGNADLLMQNVRKVFKDADTLNGYFPGTHANEVLVLDKAGNINIFGHIETQGQLRSHAPDGVMPIVIDSMTKVENLNADYLDDLDSKDFTLAYVTQNGNITYEDVFLEGNVEIGKELRLKGALKLFNELSVYGKLGVFADAVFSKEVRLTGGNLTLEKGDIKVNEGAIELIKGNLRLQEGTIEINSTAMIENLNAEFLQGKRPGDFTLDYVVGNGSSTNRLAFFNGGIYGGDGAFRSIGVAGDASFGSSANRDSTRFTVFSKYFTVDGSGNVRLGGSPGLVTFGTNISSSLIPSGSYDLGSSGQPWNNLYVNYANIGNASISGDLEVSGNIIGAVVATNSSVSGNFQVGGVVELSDGTAAAPSLTFENDMDSGLFRIGSDALGFTAGGTQRFQVSSTGASSSVPFEVGSNVLYVDASANRVGINTQNLTEALEVVGNTSVSGDGYFQGNVGIGTTAPNLGALELYGAAGTSTIGQVFSLADFSSCNSKITGEGVSGSVELNFQLGCVNNIRFDRNGNVGIGTTAPTTKLDVSGSASVSGNLELSGFVASNLVPKTDSTFTLGSPALRWASLFATNASISGTFEANTASVSQLFVGGTALRTVTSNSLNFDEFVDAMTLDSNLTVASAGFTWDFLRTDVEIGGTASIGNTLWIAKNSGNVGIGTSTPQTKFEVQGGASASYIITGGILQAGNAGATVSYSRFGDATTGHGLNTADDLLISGDLEIDGAVYFDGSINIVGVASAQFFRAQDGSAPAPSFSFIEDTDTGLFRVGTNNLGFSAGGSQRFNISSEGASISVPFEATTIKAATYTGDGAVVLQSGGSNALTIDTGGAASLTIGGTNASVLQIGRIGVVTTFNDDIRIIGNDLQDSSAVSRITFTSTGSTGTTTVTGNADATGHIKAGTDLIAAGVLQAGGTATVSYSRFGTNATSHSLNTSSDILVSGRLEVDGDAYFDSGTLVAQNASVGGSFEVSGVVKLSDGSAANPSLTFSNDTDTGLYRFADNTIGFAAGGMVIAHFNNGASFSRNLEVGDSIFFANVTSGNVGIGTSTPQTKFEVQGGASASYIITGGILQAGNAGATVSYSRFGNGATTHGLDSADDLLISGDLEVDGIAYFDASTIIAQSVSVSQNFEASGYASVSALFGAGLTSCSTGTTQKLLWDATTGKFSCGVDQQGLGSGGQILQVREFGVPAGFDSMIGSMSFNAAHFALTASGGNDVAISLDWGDGGPASLSQNETVTGEWLFANDTSVSANFEVGTNAFLVNSTTGNVGIGTSNPTALLHVRGDASTLFSVASGSNSRFAVLESGNVGIGTSTPGSIFSIRQDSADTAFGSVNSAEIFINANATANNKFSTLYSYGAGTGAIVGAIFTRDANFTTHYVIQTRGTSGLTEKFRITGEGNVGIGTTTPAARLDVISDAIFRQGLQVAHTATAAYSRFGSNTTGHSTDIDAADDLLISGSLEVDGRAFFDADASISGVFEGTTVKATTFTGDGAVTLRSGGGNTLSLEAPSGALNIANDANTSSLTLARTGLVTVISDDVRIGGNGIQDSSSTERITFTTTGAAGLTTVTGDLAVTGSTFSSVNSSVSGNFEVGGVIKAADGSVGAPSYTFSDDTDTGLYRIGTNTLGITAGGVEIARFDSGASFSKNFEVGSDKFYVNATTGQVGVGTNAPSTLFEVQGTASASYFLTGNALQVAGYTSTAYSRFGTNTTGYSSAIDTANDLLISGSLEVDGDTWFDGNASVAGNFEVSGVIAGYSIISNASISGNLEVSGVIKLSDGSAPAPSLTFENDTNTGLFRPGTDILGFTTGGTERVRFDASGNVGIGTTSPTAKTHIVGDTPTLFNVASGSSSRFTVLENGNVGIGTVPAHLFSITKTPTAANQYAQFIDYNLNNGFAGRGLYIDMDQSGSGNISHSGLFVDVLSTSGDPGGGKDAFGIVSQVIQQATENVRSVQGIYSDTRNAGTAGTVATLAGMDSIVYGTGNGGTTANFYGIRSRLGSVDTGHTATNYSAFYVDNRVNGSGTLGTYNGVYVGAIGSITPTLTNEYGIRVANQAFGSVNNRQIYLESQTYGTNNYSLYADGGRYSLGYASQTVPSAAGATLDVLRMPAATVTLSGSTDVTTATGFNLINIARPTYSAASGLTVSNAATFYVAHSPLGAGSATITNPYAIWVDDGVVRFDGNVGIGAVSPEQKLEVAGNVLASASANVDLILHSLVSGAGTDGKFTIRASGSAGVDQLRILNGAGTSLVAIASSGNVGIGTTSPETKLEISGGAVSASQTFGSGLASCSDESTQKLLWNSSTGQFSCASDLGAGGGGRLEVKETGVFADSAVASLSFNSAHFSLTASGTEDVTISLDWGDGGPASLSQNETVTGNWIFSSGTSISGNFEVAGVVELADGSATNPSLTFENDMNTGLFRPGTDILGFTTGGTERVRFDASGNVGINDTSAEQKLTVVGNILASTSGNVDLILKSTSATAGTDQGMFTLRSAGSSERFDILNGAGSQLVTIGSQGSVNFNPAAAQSNLSTVYVNPAQTTTSVTSLHVGGTSGANGVGVMQIGGTRELIFKAGGGGSPLLLAPDGYLAMGSADASVDQYQHLQFNFGTTSSISTRTNTTGNLAIRTPRGYLSFETGSSGTNQVERMRITTGGNVGIGTTSPLTKFEVQGTASASHLLTTGGLQVAGGSSVAYSRFGSNTTGHSTDIDAADDLLISGSLEVDGRAFFDADASISGVFEGTTVKATTFTGDGAVSVLSNGTNTLRLDSTGAGTINIGDTNAAAINIGRSTVVTNIVDDLRVTGNDIQDSGGTARVSFTTGGSSGITTLTGTALISQNASVAGNFEVGANQLYVQSSSGNVGIGTNSPTSAFHVVGDTTVLFNVASGSASRFAVAENGNVGVGTSAPQAKFEVQGTASASYILAGNSLQVAGYASTAYSRFGTDTTGYPSAIDAGNDLLISGSLEVDSDAFFDANASVAGNFEVTGTLIAGSVVYNTSSVSGDLEVGGVVKLADGSAPVPSLTFANDTNTGLFRPGTDILAFTTGGTERVRFDASGNVGINDTSAEQRLTVAGNIMASTSGNVDIILKSTTAAGDEGKFVLRSAGASDRFDILTNSTARFSIASGGNVGIGTTTPVYKLQVANVGRTDGLAVTGANSPGLTINASNGDEWEIFAAGNNNSLAAGGLAFYNNTDGAYRMTIHGSGNVGIGTNEYSPEQVLTVRGNILASTSGNVDLTLNSTTSDDSNYTIRANGASNLFQILGSASQNYVSITKAGNVGIGTTSPLSLLHVGAGADSPNLGNTLYVTTNGSTVVGIRDSTNDIELALGAFSTGFIGTRTNHNLSLQTAGVNHVTLTTGGNVGIGTTAPSAKLEVTADAIFRQGLQVAHTATASYSRFGSNITGHSAVIDAADDLLISNSLEVDSQAFFDADVSVSSNFEVSGFASASQTFGSGLADCDASSAKLLWDVTTGTFSCGSDLGGSGGAALNVRETGVFDDIAVATISFNPSHFSLAASSSDDVAISLDWGVGGPASLSQNETVTGEWLFANNTSVSGNFEIGTNTLYVNPTTGNVGIGTNSPTALLHVIGDQGTLLNVASGSASRFTVLENGRVGVNTATPQGLFEVQGTASASYGLFGTLQVGAFSSVSYNRFGSATATSALLGTANDLMISGDLEVDGLALFDGGASSSGIIEAATLKAATVTGDGALSVLSGGANTLRLDAGGAGVINIGDVNATAINISRSGITTTILGSLAGPGNLLNITGNVDVSGHVKAGDELIVTNAAQFGGTSTAAYSRFGTATTTHSNFISASNDLLISGDLEVDGTVSFDGFVKLGSSTGNFDPAIDNTYTLGDTNYRWKSINVGPGSIDITSTTGTSGAGSNYTLGQLSFGSGASFSLATSAVGTGSVGTIQLKTGSNTGLYINTAGNVGIGTTAPGSLLHIGGGTLDTDLVSAAGNISAITNTGVGTYARLYISGPLQSDILLEDSDAATDDKFYQIINQNQRLVFRTLTDAGALENASVLTLSKTGTVGIGTLSPDYILEIASASTTLALRSTTSTASVSIDLNPAGGASSSNQNKFTLRAGGSTGTGGERLEFLNGVGTSLMTIASSGNVGIGTTTPGQKLDISGSSTGGIVGRLRNADSTGNAFWRIENDTNQFGSFAIYGSAFSSAAFRNNVVIGAQNSMYLMTNSDLSSGGTGSISFVTGGFDTSTQTRMTVGANGNVGIGTTSPETKLEISGGAVSASQTFGSGLADCDTGATSKLLWDVTTGKFSCGTDQSAGTAGWTDDGTVVRLTTSTDNVGIGTTSPLSKFQVNAAITDVDLTSNGSAIAQIVNSEGADTSGLFNMINFRFQNGIANSGSRIGVINATGGAAHMIFAPALGSNPVERMRLTSAGNLGIGTTAPGAKLDVASDVIFREVLQVAGTATASYSRFGTTATTHSNYMSTANDLLISGDLEVRGSVTFALPASISNTLWVSPGSTGYVGIGTTSPLSKFQVNAAITDVDLTSNGSAIAQIVNSQGADTSGLFNMINFRFQNGIVNSNSRIGVVNATSGNAHMIFAPASISNPIERMRLTSAGNLGVGTTTPLTKLHVQGAGVTKIGVRDSSNSGFLQMTAGTNSALAWNQSTDLFLGTKSTVDADAWVSQIMTIKGSGNVGIGTTSPETKLEISGGAVSASQTFGSGLADCDNATGSKLLWDATTGVFSCGSDAQGASSAGGWTDDGAVVRLSTAADSVGIGTTVVSAGARMEMTGGALYVNRSTASVPAGTPAAGIEAWHTGQSSPVARFTAASSFASDLVVVQTNDTATGAYTLLKTIIDADGTPTYPFVINGDGNVGIGTTTPAAKFEVSKSPFALNTGPAARIIATGAGGSNGSGDYTTKMLYVENSSTYTVEATNDTAIGLHVSMSPTNIRHVYPGIFQGGNVGIGVTSPDYILEVASASGTFAISSTASTASVSIDFLPAGGSSLSSNQNKFTIRAGGSTGRGERLDVLNAAGTSLFSIASGGNVGIGTTSPQAKLEVDSALLVGTLSGFNPGTSDTGIYTAGSANALSVFRRDMATYTAAAAGDQWSLYSPTNDRLSFWTSGATGDIMTLASTGYVGIGTTNPTRKLEVAGIPTGQTVDYIRKSATTNNQIGFNINRTDGTYNADSYLYVPASSTSFAIWHGGAERLQISASGLVGIGTLSPKARLHVADGTTTRFRVYNTGEVVVGQETGIYGTVMDVHFAGGNTQFGIEFIPDANDTYAALFQNASDTNVGSIYTTATTTTYNTTSDRRLKENFASTSLGLETLMRIKVQDYNFIADPEKHKVQGFIAQQLYDHYPQAVTVGGASLSMPWSVDYGRVTPLLVQSIQELAERVADLEEVVMAKASSTSSAPTVQTYGGSSEVLQVIADVAQVVMKKLWVTGDVIAQGAKKTYFKVADLFPTHDLAVMVENWSSREVSIEPTETDARASLFRGSDAKAADQSKLDLKENGNYLATYGVDSTRGEIQLSGTNDLVSGEAKVFFDFSFTSVISDTAPIRVIITPSSDGIQGQLYVATKTPFGFVVKELNGSSNGKFDWLVIARRKGFEDPVTGVSPTPSPVASPTTSESVAPTPSSEPTPTPSATPEPNVEPTPTPSVTSEPSSTPEPTPSATPEPTPSATPAPTPSSTPDPTPVATPEPTPSATPDPAPAP